MMGHVGSGSSKIQLQYNVGQICVWDQGSISPCSGCVNEIRDLVLSDLCILCNSASSASVVLLAQPDCLSQCLVFQSLFTVVKFNGLAVEARVWKDKGVSDADIPTLLEPWWLLPGRFT